MRLKKKKNGSKKTRGKFCCDECRRKYTSKKIIEAKRIRYSEDATYREKLKEKQRLYNKTERGKEVSSANKLSRDKRINNFEKNR